VTGSSAAERVNWRPASDTIAAALPFIRRTDRWAARSAIGSATEPVLTARFDGSPAERRVR
jgi:hypothetical protein